MMQTCLPGVGKIKLKKNKEASPVPAPVLRSLAEQGNPYYASVANVTMDRHFGYVYSSNDIADLPGMAPATGDISTLTMLRSASWSPR